LGIFGNDMPQEVEIPGVGVAEFPDEMPQEKIRAFLRQKYSPGGKQQSDLIASLPTPEQEAGERETANAYGDNTGFTTALATSPAGRYLRGVTPLGGQIPDVSQQPNWVKALAGAGRTAQNFVSPDSLALMAATGGASELGGPLVDRALKSAFVPLMTRQAAQSAGEAAAAYQQGDVEKTAEKSTDAIANALLSGMGVDDAVATPKTKALAKKVAEKVVEQQTQNVGEPQNEQVQQRKNEVDVARDQLETGNTQTTPNVAGNEVGGEPTPQHGQETSGEVGRVPVTQEAPNAIQERSAAETALGETPKDSGTVGARASEPETSPVSQGGKGGDEGISQTPQAQELKSGDEGYGIAARVRDARAASGEGPAIAPGEGIAAPDSVERGRTLLNQGADPESVLADFEKTKRFSSDDIAVVRAQGEKLAKAAHDAENEHGTDSEQYKTAFDALSKWDERSKALQTEWHKSGQAQQGETDIDTGSFTGLQRAFVADSGRDFTPKEAVAAKDIASKSSAADTEAASAQKKLLDEVGKPPSVDPQVKSLADRIIAALDKKADAARLRLRGKLLSPSPEDFADLAVIGASHIAHGLRDFAAWSKRMTDEFTDKIAPHLDKIWKDSNDHLDSTVTDPKVRRAIKPDDSLWGKAKVYIDQGLNFDDIRNRLATDTGKPVAEVTKELTKNQNVKRLADDAWLKQKKARELKSAAKRWLAKQATPKFIRAIESLPRWMFTAKVFGHGMVAFGTHAPMVAFQPRFWPEYLRDYGKMGKMVLNPAFYEMQRADLQRGENYVKAQRAGLVNNPDTYEDLDNPIVTKMFGGLAGAGNRGYFALKLLRQDMFDKMWDSLPASQQIPEVASAIADGINHSTGVTKARSPRGLNNILFAPRLEASRIAWLAADPIKATRTFANWKNATEGEKAFAINQAKEKAWVVGTALSLLAANQGILNATGSKQKINFNDPMKSDFLKFKGFGMDFSYGNPFITLARLPVRLFTIRDKGGSGKLAKLVYPDESMISEVGKYARTQLAPGASLAADIAFKGDYENRPLPKMPFSGPVLPVPNRLKKEGIKPYTWAEFTTEAALPIPFEEGAREVWRYGFGMSPQQQKQAEKALASIAVMSATGGRLTEDYSVPQK